MFKTDAFSSSKPFFWTIVAGLVLASGLFTQRYFTQSHPIVSLSISMNREEALEQAQALQRTNNWLPAEPRAAVKFKNDETLQYFIELECGGKQAFSELLSTKLYQPYQWHVRLFQEKITDETSIFFTPEGTPYGFSIKVPETTLRPSLSPDEARQKAKTCAQQDWNSNFDDYKEIEYSKDKKACGRIDHTFVYERINAQLGAEGKYRLTLIVTGDTVTQVLPSVLIPESFKRRFEEMRSSNTTVLTIGKVGLQLLYIFAGCLIAGFFFLRKRYLQITPGFYWALLLGILQYMSSLNELPLAWMSYNTATSANSFLMQYFLLHGLEAAGMIAFLTVLFSIAITWDRLAFPEQINFWSSWSTDVGSSLALLGRTVGGYACSVIFIGIMTATYLILTQLFHWWCPADTLTDPSILSHYLPWLTPFSLSLSAGMVEEMLFRALPLGACLAIGRFFKKEKTGIFVGFMLQAFIFAACHAGYPQMPGYFRLVELFIPSLLFGLIYFFFGLVPGILSHFFYDLLWMSLPLFVTQGSQSFANKVVIILFFLTPLLVILLRRYRHGLWYVITAKDRNLSFFTTLKNSDNESMPEEMSPAIQADTLPTFNKKALLVSGIVGLALWLYCTPFTADTPPLVISKSEALEQAQADFESHALATTPEGFTWETLCYIASIPTTQEFFIWRTEGKERYHELLNSYLTPASWAIRFLSFSGPITERAYEFTTLIGPDGSPLRNNLKLPESAAGATLEESIARSKALEAITSAYDLAPEDLKEISATPVERPHRKDWTFIFQDKTQQFSTEGQARLQVIIAGDIVVNCVRFIFVPESWVRDQQQKDLYLGLANLILLFIKILLCVFSFLVLRTFFMRTLTVKKIAGYAAALIPLTILAKCNGLPQIIGLTFSTAQPYLVQLFTQLASVFVVSIIVVTALCTALVAIKNIWAPSQKNSSFILYGIAAQLLLEGVLQAILFVRPRYLPFIPDYVSYNCWSPFFCMAVSSTLLLLQMGTLQYMCIAAFTHVSSATKKHQLLWGVLFFIGSAVTYCWPLFLYPSTAVLVAVILGGIFTCIYYGLLRYDARTVIIMAATQLVLSLLQQGFQGNYPHILPCAFVVSCGILLAACYWFMSLAKQKGTV